jgi:hypothetical protein
MRRYDGAYVTDFKEDTEGYLTVTAAITRPGVFPYRRGDGTIHYEAKLPDDIFDQRVLDSAKSKPVTDEHPNEPVTTGNIRTYVRGMTHTDSRVEDKMVKVTMTVFDPDLIRQIKEEDKRELSIGFDTEVVAEPGVYQGMSYDYRQTNIAINHVAVVKAGRAGPEVAIRGDSEAFMLDADDPAIKAENEKKGGPNMAKIRIDNAEYEVPSEVKSAHESLTAQLAAEKTLSASAQKLEGEKAALEAQLAAKNQELEAAKEGALTGDKLDAAIEKRVALVETAKKVLGDSFDYKGKSDLDVKIEVAKKFSGDSVDFTGKSEDFVEGFYTMSITAAQKSDGADKGSGSRGDNTVFTGAHTQDAQDKIDAIRAGRQNMFKGAK